MTTTYTTMTSTLGWYQGRYALNALHDYCDVRHRTLAAAVRCDEKHKARVRRATGGNTWIDTRIIVWDGDEPRFLTETEEETAFDLAYDAISP